MNYKLMFFIFILLILFLIYKLRNNKIILGTYTPYPDIITINKPDNIKTYIGIVRHGTRFPTKNVFKQMSSEIKDKLQDKNIGEIHKKGIVEMDKYGKYLSIKYPKIFSDPNNIKVFSTKMDRAIDSANAAVKGMNMHGFINIEYNDDIESFLKLKNILKEKTDHNPLIMRCQFTKALDLDVPKYCHFLNFKRHDTKKNIDTYNSIHKTHVKGYPFYNILTTLIKNCKMFKNYNGYLFFCHDSTLAPIYYLFSLLPEIDSYNNTDWLPFGARLEIMIDIYNNVYFFVNDRLIRIE